MQASEIITSALDTIAELSEIFAKLVDDRNEKGNLIGNWKDLERKMQRPVTDILTTFSDALKNFSLLMKNTDLVSSKI